MTLETEIPLVPKSAPPKLRPVFAGACDEKCSVKFFRDNLPESWDCEEISSEKKWAHHLRAFWYPENSPSSSLQPPANLIQRKIQAFLFSLESFMPSYWGKTALVQFWASVTSKDGKKTLSVSRQPFAVRKNMKGLCRYRFYCQELTRFNSKNSREVGPYFGPVGRAFTRGSLEFSPELDVYSEEEFPLKNHAKNCGFVGYLALPVFEPGDGDSDVKQQSCVGVLEFVSFTKDRLSSFDTRICMKKLKEVGLAFRYPQFDAITQIRPYFNFPAPQDACKGNPDELSALLDFVREKFGLPLVQIWLPCICNGSEVSVDCEPNNDSFSKVTHLVCGLQCVNRDEKLSEMLSWYAYSDLQVYFVEDGEIWVGRAHLLKKICYIKDTRQYNILDYPLGTLGHSSNLLACFAVPLQLLNPKLPPLVLEVFLPTQYNFDEDQGAIFKRILFMFARELFKYNARFGIRQEEEYSLEIFHSEDDCDCFYLDLHHGIPTEEEDDAQHQLDQPGNATEIEELQVPTTEAIGDRSTLKRKCQSFREMRPTRPRNDVLSVHQIPVVLPTISVDYSDAEQQSGNRSHSSDNSNEGEHEAANGKEKAIDNGASTATNRKGASTASENGKCNNAADDSCTVIVRARHNDDFVRFPFSSYSGIEGLRRDVAKRFELRDGGFKIKYQDDGYWIMLSCSEDLSFYMHSLKSCGQTTMDLVVFSSP